MSGVKGFVTFLYDQLTYEFRRLGEPRPKLWRDTRNIEHADQFEPLLEQEIAASDFLIVVLSRNWLARPWCLRELDFFVRRWQHEGDAVRRRIIVVAKRYVEPSQRPSWLQGQEGYSFFRIDREELLAVPVKVGVEQEYYERGEVRDPICWTLLARLASYLWRAAASLSEPQPSEPQPSQPASNTAASVVSADPKTGAAEGPIAPSPNTLAPQPAGPNPNGKPASERTSRTIYVAKPAGDMREAYYNVVEELQARGYKVEPPVDSEIPHDHTALAFVTDALAKGELSIHLLGNKHGFAPEDAEPITTLQLKRAADRGAGMDASKERHFWRIVWAPKALTEQGSPDSSSPRDPLGVLANFDQYRPSDKVEGDNLSKFVEFLIQHLEKTTPSRELAQDAAAQSRVYLYHRLEDQDYAVELALALKDRQIEPIIPALEGDAADLSSHHRQNLLQCDAVILCWANASEVWARATARELSEWRGLGRTKSFAYRALVAGPPPAARKSVMVKLPPRSDIDIVLDLTASPKPLPEALDQLVLSVGPAAS